ncbi:MAG: phosphoribosylanthranilate isomerase [Eubacteriales bacterium]|nr:phosphoribosylanthranilate isomerase [Eubacteriales bacterium]MDD3349874.1 phosphoribosylanthranilate isomerase [Eubacteriales bacterium]
MKIKFCGLSRRDDIFAANELLPDYIGFVFAKSKRQISAKEAATLNAKLDSGIKSVGVFVNESAETILRIKEETGISIIQLHGDEDAALVKTLKTALPDTEIWKAVRTESEESILNANDTAADFFLLDSFTKTKAGGSGETADWELIRSCKSRLNRPFFLAGGLNAANIEEAICTIAPFGIDVSSGIETNGRKDPAKMREIIKKIRG